ncbi:MAG: hypothetical protein N4A38_04000 [Candidatus Gracilibacteria bacterium]|nr:hypothetical protein [Candidatus Gracilibacteria bacterium]
MNASKLFAACLALFGFAIISFMSFSPGYSVDPLSFETTEKGIKKVIIDSNTIKLDKIMPEDKEKENLVYVNNLSILDGVYYTVNKGKSSLGIKNLESENVFQIRDGLFAFILNDINQKKKIEHNGFTLEPLSTGKFYVDSRNPNNTIIYSSDVVLDVKLKDTDTKAEVTSFLMYPHNVFKLKIGLNKYLKNADLFRISNVLSLSYLPDAIFDEDGKINNNISKSIGIKENDEEAIKFLEIFGSILSFKENQTTKKYEEIKKTKVTGLEDRELLDKNFGLLINKDKKIIYYKNKILRQINELFAENIEINSKLKKEIINDFLEIKSLDEEEYKNMKEILSSYYNILIYYNSLDLFINKMFLGEILEEISGKRAKKEKFFSEKYLYLNSVFSSYDTNKIDKKELYGYISDFLNNYYFSEKQEINLGNYDKKSFESLSFWFEKMFKDNFDLSPKYAMSNLDLLENFLKINKFLLVGANKTVKETYLYSYNSLLKKFSLEFYNNFFEEDRGESNLLVLKKYPDKDNEIYKKFRYLVYGGKGFGDNSDNSNSIYKYIEKRVALFKDDTDKKSFDKLKNDFLEHIEAKDDYNIYETKYDKATKAGFETQVIGSQVDYSLSKEKFEEYFSQFRGINYNLDNLVVDNENEKYSLSFVNINGKLVSFDLYPNQRNRIENFVVDGKEEKYAYKLDNIEVEWEQKKSEEEDYEKKQNYEFSLFFPNTFRQQRETHKDNYEKGTNIITDSRAQIVFKKDKLLGPQGEFRSLKGFLDIKYNNINLSVGENDVFDIKIKGATINEGIESETAGIENYKIDFDSDYIFTNVDHKFDNIEMYFYEGKGSEDFFDYYAYYSEPLKISGTIEIVEFKKKMTEILEHMIYMGKLIGVIKKNYSSDFQMIYNLENSQINIFYKDKRGQSVNIKLDSNGKVSKFVIGRQSFVGKPVSIGSLYNLNINN